MFSRLEREQLDDHLTQLTAQREALEAELQQTKNEIKSWQVRHHIESQVRKGKEDDVRKLLRVSGLPLTTSNTTSSMTQHSENSHSMEEIGEPQEQQEEETDT